MALSLTLTVPSVPLFGGCVLDCRDGCIDAVHVNVGTGGNLHKSTQIVRQDTEWHED